MLYKMQSFLLRDCAKPVLYFLFWNYLDEGNSPCLVSETWKINCGGLLVQPNLLWLPHTVKPGSKAVPAAWPNPRPKICSLPLGNPISQSQAQLRDGRHILNVNFVHSTNNKNQLRKFYLFKWKINYHYQHLRWFYVGS